MSKLKLLEVQRLLKELQFVESDYLFQSEILKQSEHQFLTSVHSILDTYPDLKIIWDERSRRDQTLKSDVSLIDDTEIITKPVIEPEVKKIYRDIVKTTHPDRIKNPKLNELYLEATVAYESNDIVNLIRVCNDLMIDVEWRDDVLKKVEERISLIKQQIHFLESTYTFKWLKSHDDNDRNKIVLKFIENTLK